MTGWNATTDDVRQDAALSTRHSHDASTLALVIVWSAEQPTRIGEIARLPVEGASYVLGRGDARADDGATRLKFFRERPRTLSATEPLAGASLSRRQLILLQAGNAIEYQRVGACEVFLNGRPCSAGAVRPGDTLRLGAQLVLYCVSRAPSSELAAVTLPDEAFAFGAPDAAGIVGESAAAWQLRVDIAFAAAAAGHVLVRGDSGVGKELVARAIHRLSSRRNKPFVARSATSFPESLVDAELFGTARSFPNAGMSERTGVVGAADGGVLFLDEIGELPPELQAHLLRVLDHGGEYHRLGEATARRSDFRLVAATNRAVHSLKRDFAARLPIRIEVPDLNDRVEDVALLIRHIMHGFRRDSPDLVARFFQASDEPSVHPRLIEQILRRRYATNVRELTELLLASVRSSPSSQLDAIPAPGPVRPAERARVPDREVVRAALARQNGHIERAARELGLSSRYALYRLMKKFGITRNGVFD